MAALSTSGMAEKEAIRPCNFEWTKLGDDGAVHVCSPTRIGSASKGIVSLPRHTMVTFHYELWNIDAQCPSIHADKSLLGKPFDASSFRGHPVRLRIADVHDVLQAVLCSAAVGSEMWISISTSKLSGSLLSFETSSFNPPKALLVCIHLLSADTTSIAYNMNRAIVLKDEGARAFKEEKWRQAAACYKASLRLALDIHGGAISQKNSDDDATKEISALRATLHLNMASCHLNNGNPRRAVSRCTKALAVQSQNYKALVRRAKALTLLNRHDDAVRDLTLALEILQVKGDPDLRSRIAKLLARAKRKAK